MQRILFQGDSITDWYRDYKDGITLGRGFVSYVAQKLQDQEVEVLNRGISGNTTLDMAKRFDVDGLALKPDLLTIMIGINDTWQAFLNQKITPASEFKQIYRDVLLQVKQETTAKLILMEPFLLPFPEDRKAWREDLDPKIHVVRELALEFDALLIPLDGLMNAAGIKYGFTKLIVDGVHPTDFGHHLLADIWLDAVYKNGYLQL
ncbi:GDSL lipase/acylhydrolase [Listeria floridensis FSL S10-1187]|uniref:GDSL lipase/acylhydrolase n=1 Tax=Listeria floridensis FSL S10-1187 TaxID=1265817 RepID=A0ABN0RBS1_9LIST|nr:SGNH/GDSL hydrolase family protein [Listeria floridensis]EUJ25855.1 GDSL lipase/acylhydrolase [Listeria floridensis FSL S10-1187]